MDILLRQRLQAPNVLVPSRRPRCSWRLGLRAQPRTQPTNVCPDRLHFTRWCIPCGPPCVQAVQTREDVVGTSCGVGCVDVSSKSSTAGALPRSTGVDVTMAMRDALGAGERKPIRASREGLEPLHTPTARSLLPIYTVYFHKMPAAEPHQS